MGNIEFLQCDEPNCDHIEHHDIIDETMINRKCPKCDSNLLTEDDFHRFKHLMTGYKEITGVLNMDLSEGDDTEEKSLVSFSIHEGIITMYIEPKED